YNPYWLPEQLSPELKDISITDVELYAQQFLKQVQIEALIHGNVAQDHAVEIVTQVADQIKVNTERTTNIPLPFLVNLPNSANYTYMFNPDHADATIVSYMQAPQPGDKAV